MSRVAVVGASGFVGGAVVSALKSRGADVVAVKAPRLSSGARNVADLGHDLDREDVQEALAVLRHDLHESSVVVNAAGVAAATERRTPGLIGANALLPVVLAAARPPKVRLVQVSTAAVQGSRAVLDETPDMSPFSPYSETKALAEEALADLGDVVIYRPTSVHGPGRDITRSLVRVLGSPLASVSGAGDAPTPQTLVPNVADAIAFLALWEGAVPQIVLHPWEGLTVAELGRRLGGREPRHLPTWLARTAVVTGAKLGRRWPRLAGDSRRLEMLWFGQRQVDGWLSSRWTAPVGLNAWDDLR